MDEQASWRAGGCARTGGDGWGDHAERARAGRPRPELDPARRSGQRDVRGAAVDDPAHRPDVRADRQRATVLQGRRCRAPAAPWPSLGLGGAVPARPDLRAAQQPGLEPHDLPRLRRRERPSQVEPRWGLFGSQPAWNLDGSANSFSADEQTVIQNVWLQVSEDYAAVRRRRHHRGPGRRRDRPERLRRPALRRPRADHPQHQRGGHDLRPPPDGGCGGVAFTDVVRRDHLAPELPAGLGLHAVPRRRRPHGVRQVHRRGGRRTRSATSSRPRPRRHRPGSRLLRGPRRLGADHGRRLRPADRAVEQGRLQPAPTTTRTTWR